MVNSGITSVHPSAPATQWTHPDVFGLCTTKVCQFNLRSCRRCRRGDSIVCVGIVVVRFPDIVVPVVTLAVSNNGDINLSARLFKLVNCIVEFEHAGTTSI